MKKYKEWFWVKTPPETTIFLSRGCPYDCSFCSNIVWKISKPALRLRSPKNIVDEMEYLKNTFSINSFFDAGDEFNNNEKHAIAICKEIISRKLNVALKASMRAWPLSEELVSLMAEAGFWWVQLGIESGNQATIDGIKKHITHDQVENALRLLKKYKIKVFGLFMLFHFWEIDGVLKYENAEDSLRTVAYAKKLIDKKLVSYVSSNITTPYPGSQLYPIAERHKLFRDGLNKSWDRWLAEDDFVVNIPGVSIKEASNVYLKASLLRSYGYIRSGNWRFKDIPILAKKFGRVLSIMAGSLFKQAPRQSSEKSVP
jgi:anaerobic magnesium-protoporphyrin IX monomethyl ester cyclase